MTQGDKERVRHAQTMWDIRDVIVSGGGRAMNQEAFDQRAMKMVKDAHARCLTYKMEGNVRDIEFVLTVNERNTICYLLDIPNGTNTFLTNEIKRLLWAS